MKTLNPKTKKAQSFINSYNHYLCKNMGDNIYKIYKKPSQEKVNAFNYCRALKEQLEGFNPCFCGHNCDQFTYAFLFIKEGKTYLCYMTYLNEYVIEYND